MTFTLFCLFALTGVFGYWLRQLNLSYLKQHGDTVPAGFETVVTREVLAKSRAYILDNSRLDLWESLATDLQIVLFLFTGLLGWYDRFTSELLPAPISQAVAFFILLAWLQTLLAAPFSLYRIFEIEARHGFNTMTPKLWLGDRLKSLGLETLISGLLLWSAFALMGWSRDHWWLWVWAFLALFTLFLLFLSPYVIEPLFNRFTPVTDNELQGEIGRMMAKAGLRMGNVLQMDASKRSRHANAYFTGIGKVKRIVLYDTLLQEMTPAEIVAVLAHEIGHWQLGHVWKRLLLAETGALAASWIAFRLLAWDGLPGLLGYSSLSLAARLVVLGFVASLALFPLTPLNAWLSRRDEFEADRYAVQLIGDPEPLATALIKLSTENLANLHPHPLYAAIYYSHPPVVKRVAVLRSMKQHPINQS